MENQEGQPQLCPAPKLIQALKFPPKVFLSKAIRENRQMFRKKPAPDASTGLLVDWIMNLFNVSINRK